MSGSILKEIRGLLFKTKEELVNSVESLKVDMSDRMGKVEDRMGKVEHCLDENTSRLVLLSKQVGRVSETCGINVEVCARRQISEYASFGAHPFLHFSSKESRSSAEWSSVYNVTHHLGLKHDEEEVVVKRLCSVLKVKKLKLFLNQLPSTLCNVLLLEQRCLGAIKFENHSLQWCLEFLQNLKADFKENAPPLVNKLVDPTLKFLGSVRKASTNKELQLLAYTASKKIKGQFLLMYLIWLASNEIRSCLEVDLVGTCTRMSSFSGTCFFVCMGEIKSSKEQIGDAKKQLALACSVINLILAKLPHYGKTLEVSFQPLIMLYKGKVPSHDGFTICGFCD